MDRPFAAIAVATALHLLAALHGAGPRAASARPLAGRLSVGASQATTSSLALAPAAAHQHRRAAAGDGDAAAREGKWLPFLGAHHLPPAYWAHKPVPWAAGAGVGASTPELGGAGAVEGGEGEEEREVVRDRERRRHKRPSYAGAGAASTRQEQLAMWASLLNPKGRGTSATGWLPAPGIGEAADEEPAKVSADTPVEGAEVDEQPSAGQNYWGNNGN